MHSQTLRPDHGPLPPIAVGILSFNRREETLTTLRLLRATEYPADRIRLILVDNASSDGTVDAVIREFGDAVEIVAMKSNSGVSARNLVMLKAPEAYIFMFDEDSAPERPDTIRRAVAFMRENPRYGALCFHVRNAHTGALEFGDVRVIAGRRRPDGVCEAMRIVGAGMCYRREAIQSTTGYDRLIFWGGEEHDLTLRFIGAGISIAHHADFTIIHRQAPRALTGPQVSESLARNDVRINFKYFPIPLALLVTLLHTTRWFLGALSRRDGDGARAVLRGTRLGFTRLGEIMPRRSLIPLSTLAGHSRWFVRMLNILP